MKNRKLIDWKYLYIYISPLLYCFVSGLCLGNVLYLLKTHNAFKITAASVLFVLMLTNTFLIIKSWLQDRQLKKEYDKFYKEASSEKAIIKRNQELDALDQIIKDVSDHKTKEN